MEIILLIFDMIFCILHDLNIPLFSFSGVAYLCDDLDFFQRLTIMNIGQL